MMKLKFTKMHGLGNDFIVLNGLEQVIDLTREQLRMLSDRRFGIGCDQVLLLQPPNDPAAQVRYRIFNADGGEVEQCGNGARCIAAYLSRNGYVHGNELIAETVTGNLIIHLESEDRITVNMGIPSFEPLDIPLLVPARSNSYSVDLTGGPVSFMAVSMGNPHAVLIVNDVDWTPVAALGTEIQSLKIFPQGVNVGFMQIVDTGHIRLRVFERGVGETLACGSGACAAMVSGCLNNRLANAVDIGLKGGHLIVSWAGEGAPVYMTGPATTVYEGQIEL
jgi:diaminopimelate epimerase